MERFHRVVFLLIVAILGLGVLISASDLNLPGNNQGYAPVQPIHFSHRLHAGELQIDCMYCHFGADRSRHAGIPSASLCMNCHQQVRSGHDATLEEQQTAERQGREPRALLSPELRKLYDALGLNDQLEKDPGKEQRPIEWVRVHQLPDFVYFDHRPHVARGLACETCHGPVQAMERVQQFSDLSMGWCVECHRNYPDREGDSPPQAPAVSTDCATCHF
jgi:hypothetical protein